jgi:hypothetical protein
MDLASDQMCGLHRHTLDYVLYILEGGRIAVESPGMTSNRFPGQSVYELEVAARAISYVPAGGAESARNISAGRFREAIFEIRRPLPPGVANPGFALTEAAAGKPPERGEVTLLEKQPHPHAGSDPCSGQQARTASASARHSPVRDRGRSCGMARIARGRAAFASGRAGFEHGSLATGRMGA